MLKKFVFALGVVSVLGALSFLDLSGSQSDIQISGGRCWVAGQVVCCMTPEGVICH